MTAERDASAPAVPDAAVADALSPALDQLVDDALDAVVHVVPPFREWLVDGRGIRDAVDAGLRGFFEQLRSDDPRRLPPRQAFFDFGRIEHRAGRSLDALLTAYRVGAQAAWRGMVAAGEAAELPPSVLYHVAEAIFGYIDRLSSATAEGYSYEEAIAAGEQVDRRQRLVELLLDGADPERLAAEAAHARWTVPRTLSVVALEDVRRATVASRLPADAVVARVDGVCFGVVPDLDGPGRLDQVRRALDGLRAGVGPPVVPRGAAESARRAALALRLAAARGTGLVFADEHRLDLLLLQDPALAHALAAELEEALDGSGPRGRARLLETLEAWLEHHGAVRPTAEAVGVHAQTVRYRIGRLRERLGDRLDAPGSHLELELAVRAARLVAAGLVDPDPCDPS
ncbi:MAG TPA: helix-turn-helix domain-containing protein [Baekduia sp.]|nr:helix-turn-helix domain-containing protein [Baekduia sp.]